MKRISMILMAFALMLTMTQCKRNEETNQNEIVTISLDVKDNNGSKVDVNTMIGTVNFETGDKVYVGSGGKYVGFLTHNGTHFVGNITNPTENQPLQFYFLGNVTPNETLTAGITEECSVNISDQTEHLPVISTAASNENYVSGVTAYTGHLLNKCALVKFNVTTPSNSPICITGMNNKVTVNFMQNTITSSQDGEGVIKLPAGSGENVEKWAILLPQEALGEGEEGSAYSEDGIYIGKSPKIPIISENDYLGDGIVFSINTLIIEGAVNGLFSVSETKQVLFSKGNLQYQASTNIWRFAENQWDFIGGLWNGVPYGTISGSSNNDISSTYSGWIDLFGWGTSGYNHNNACYQPWAVSLIASDFYAYGEAFDNLYDGTGTIKGKADWGCNSIINGGNQTDMWRTLTREEWVYLFDLRSTFSGIRYVKARVNEVNGVILFPDNWNPTIYTLNNANTPNASYGDNDMTNNTWISLFETNGAVFLSAAGSRCDRTLFMLNSNGSYWCSSNGNEQFANCVTFTDNNILLYNNNGKYNGSAVRLVQDYQP